MPTRKRNGFSLVELMIAIVVMAVVLAGTMNFFMGQSRTFRKATTDMVLLQNARFATDLLNEHFRSVGANLTVGQPSVIYADQKSAIAPGPVAPEGTGIHYSAVVARTVLSCRRLHVGSWRAEPRRSDHVLVRTRHGNDAQR
jgi:prepilin-type N-terminal cleavage/methylation domain-containing protein